MNEALDDIGLDDDELLEAEEHSGDGETLYEHFRIEVDKGQVSVRIDKFLAEHQPHSSRNRIQKAADVISLTFSVSTGSVKRCSTLAL